MKNLPHILIISFLFMCFLLMSCSSSKVFHKTTKNETTSFSIKEQHHSNTIIREETKVDNGLIESNIIPNDDAAVILSIPSNTLSEIGTKLIIQNGSSLEVYFGSDFIIEKNEDNKWYSLDVCADFTAEEIVLIPNASIEINILWENIYGVLEEGDYRILKEFTIGDITSFYSCEFSVLP